MERISASSTAFSVGKAGAATVVIGVFKAKASGQRAILPSIIAASGGGLREFAMNFWLMHRILSWIAGI
ncbi:hypothetical protein [Duganella levis]|uniref:hypothetical protein n=1 Tax=Duganella levis TaxID=2692169 RepID=UPI001925FD5C|nr:hypothetical protein [Duganella levis]